MTLRPHRGPGATGLAVSHLRRARVQQSVPGPRGHSPALLQPSLRDPRTCSFPPGQTHHGGRLTGSRPGREGLFDRPQRMRSPPRLGRRRPRQALIPRKPARAHHPRPGRPARIRRQPAGEGAASRRGRDALRHFGRVLRPAGTRQPFRHLGQRGRYDVVAMNRLARILFAPALADPRRPVNLTASSFSTRTPATFPRLGERRAGNRRNTAPRGQPQSARQGIERPDRRAQHTE